MKTYGIVTLLLLTICLSCNNEPSSNADTNTTEIKFDQTKWMIKAGEDYPYRSQMLKDLMDSKRLKGLKNTEVLEILGDPSRRNENYMYYRVSQQRIGMFPLSTKTLVIELTADSMVNWVKVHG